jgi:hypothetical protein
MSSTSDQDSIPVYQKMQFGRITAVNICGAFVNYAVKGILFYTFLAVSSQGTNFKAVCATMTCDATHQNKLQIPLQSNDSYS